MTSLDDFIERERDRILAAWEEFARTLARAKGEDGHLVLRNHVMELLDAIVADMRADQTKREQTEKSMGRGTAGTLDRVSAIHAELRGEQGFRLTQIVAEYRALRASVLSLWEEAGGRGGGVGRFNEAIDQAILAAVERFTTTAEHFHDQSLGILGHDLRNPLNSVIAGATLLGGETLSEAQRHEIAGRVVASGKRMNRMIEDLLDLTRTRFGDTIPIVRAPLDLGVLCAQIVAEHASQHAAGVRFVARGDLRGEWDADRIAQVVSNLVRNAIEHGARDAPITVTAEGRRDDVLIEVHNRGETIPRGALATIFDPMARQSSRVKTKGSGLGLGLYIAWHVVEAHEGEMRVESSDESGTRFTARLPRHARRALHLHPS